MYYWLVYSDGDTDIEIDPSTIVVPGDDEIIAALARANVMVEMYTGNSYSLDMYRYDLVSRYVQI